MVYTEPPVMINTVLLERRPNVNKNSPDVPKATETNERRQDNVDSPEIVNAIWLVSATITTKQQTII